MEPVRWGILSTARIAIKKVIPGMLRSPTLVVSGLASRDLHKAQAAAAELGIARAYGSYEEMLADPGIEAIYNPLPNHLHVPLTLAAARAGKHVLCEKPMAMNAAELEALRPYATKVHIHEAFSRPVRSEQPDAKALDDAAWNMRTIDALFASARSGRFERL